MEQRIKELEQKVAKTSGLLDANFIILERIDKHVRDIPHIKEKLIALDETINKNGLVARVNDNAIQIAALGEYVKKEQDIEIAEKEAKQDIKHGIKKDIWKYFVRFGMMLFFFLLSLAASSFFYTWSVLDDNKLSVIQKLLGTLLK